MSYLFSCRAALLWIAVFILVNTGAAHAVTIYDLSPNLTPPALPTVIDGANSPVYITNTYATEAEEGGGAATRADGENLGSGEVESLRVGAWSQLHLGYDPQSVAFDAISLTVVNDMQVEGTVRVGKDATYYEEGLPNSAALESIVLDVTGGLSVTNGGRILASGASDGGGEGEDGDAKHSVIRANSVTLGGGSMTLGKYSVLETGDTLPAGTTAENWYAVTIQNGGALLLNGGLPSLLGPATEEEPTGGDGGETASSSDVVLSPRPLLNTDESEWVFKGLNTAYGGQGVLVGNGGVLSAGRAGGVVAGVSGQRLLVRKGGTVDAGSGSLLVSGFDEVVVEGAYRAGYNRWKEELEPITDETENAESTTEIAFPGKTTYLYAADGTVSFAKGSTVLLARDLQRSFNQSLVSANDAVILRGKDITFADGVPTLRTGMGTYGLALGTDAESGDDYLRIGSVTNAVYANSSAADREQFRSNMGTMWWAGGMGRDQADNIYNLAVVESPSVSADGKAGELNKAVLEAITDGAGSAVGSSGVADRGLYEMYSARTQWGVNSVAFSTAEEFMAQLDRRVDRIGAEMDRLGEGWTSGQGYASSAAVPEYRVGRVWAGGFGRDESAKFEGGLSGYSYRPGGVMAGYDREIGCFNVGGAMAYGRGRYADRAATANDSKIESYSAGLFGTYHSGAGIFVSGQATYSHLENKLSDVRGGMRRKADHSSYAWTLGAKLGYDKYLADRVTLTPTIGLNRAQAVNKAHNEYLDDLSVLRVGRLRRNSLTAPLELNLGFDLMRRPDALMRLTGTMGYAYDFYNDGLSGTFSYEGLTGATEMGVEARSNSRNRFNAGLGLEFTGRRLDFGARYDYFQRKDQRTHQARGSIGVKF